MLEEIAKGGHGIFLFKNGSCMFSGGVSITARVWHIYPNSLGKECSSMLYSQAASTDSPEQA